jgi:transcription elongation factor Elf1
MTDRRFHVIDGTPPPEPATPAEQVRKRLRERSKPIPSLIQCHRCGSREVLETKIGMVYKASKASGGTKQILCAACFMRGERVVLL